jgi:hypothetical protein
MKNEVETEVAQHADAIGNFCAGAGMTPEQALSAIRYILVSAYVPPGQLARVIIVTHPIDCADCLGGEKEHTDAHLN